MAPLGCHGMPVSGGPSRLRPHKLSDIATNDQGVKEYFWGFHAISQVADHLGLERPTAGSSEEKGWRAML